MWHVQVHGPPTQFTFPLLLPLVPFGLTWTDLWRPLITHAFEALLLGLTGFMRFRGRCCCKHPICTESVTSRFSLHQWNYFRGVYAWEFSFAYPINLGRALHAIQLWLFHPYFFLTMCTCILCQYVCSGYYMLKVLATLFAYKWWLFRKVMVIGTFSGVNVVGENSGSPMCTISQTLVQRWSWSWLLIKVKWLTYPVVRSLEPINFQPTDCSSYALLTLDVTHI